MEFLPFLGLVAVLISLVVSFIASRKMLQQRKDILRLQYELYDCQVGYSRLKKICLALQTTLKLHKTLANEKDLEDCLKLIEAYNNMPSSEIRYYKPGEIPTTESRMETIISIRQAVFDKYGVTLR